jgi:hypothetical protein
MITLTKDLDGITCMVPETNTDLTRCAPRPPRAEHSLHLTSRLPRPQTTEEEPVSRSVRRMARDLRLRHAGRGLAVAAQIADDLLEAESVLRRFVQCMAREANI